MNGRAPWSTRVMQCFLGVIIACTGIVATAQSTLFTLQNPSPGTGWLNDIQNINGTLYAVGEQNGLFKSVDNGQTWMTQHADANAMTSFRSTYFTSVNRGWSVGGWERIRPQDTLKVPEVDFTNDGGATWSRQILQGATCINGVNFSSATQGWVAGRGHEPLTPFTAEKPFVYITVDNGLTWTRQTNGVPVNYGDEIKSITFTNNTTGYAIGGYAGGNDPTSQSFNVQQISGTWLITTTNSGSTWMPNFYINYGWQLTQVCPLNNSRVYICGSYYGQPELFYSSDDGSTWNPQYNGFSTNYQGILTSMKFSSAMVGYAIGYKYTNTGNNLLVMKTTNGGSSWSEMDPQIALSTLGETPIRMTVNGDNKIWIAGSGAGPWVLYSGDGGNTWMNVSTNAVLVGNYAAPTLNSVSFSDANNGWGVGQVTDNVNEIYVPGITHTTNGGATWTPQSIPSLGGYFNGVAAISSTEVWAGGSDRYNSSAILYHSLDGGNHWISIPTGGMSPINDIAFSTSNKMLGVIFSQDNVYYTTNGGSSWNPTSFGGTYGNTHVGSFIGKNIWAAINNSAVCHSTDAGMTWSTTFGNQISGFNNTTIDGVSFDPTGQFGWVSGMYAGSSGGGGSTTDVQKGTPAVVQAQQLISQAQPLIARTTNGGLTWSVQSNFQMPNPRYPCPSCGIDTLDYSYIYNEVNDIITITPSTAAAVTFLNQSAVSWGNNSGVGTRLVVTSDGGNHWYEVDSTYQGTKYARIRGALTNRLDVYGVGATAMIRHGFVNIPLIATSPDTLFKHVILSYSPTDSESQSVKVINVGTSVLSILNLQITSTDNPASSNDYSVVSAPNSLNPGDSGNIVIQFKPSFFLPRFATLTITTNSVVNPVINIGLGGRGGTAIYSEAPGSLFNKIVPVDGGSDTEVVHICNPGVTTNYSQLELGTLLLIDSTASNSYSIAYQPAGPIVQGTCDSIVVVFKPTTGGQKRGSLTIPTNSRSNTTIVVTLGGIGGIRTITMDTNSASFTDTLNCSSTKKFFVIGNSGTLPLKIDSVKIDSANKTQFAIGNGGSTIIPPGGVDTIFVTHTPNVYGTSVGTMTVFSNALNIPQAMFSLNGIGLQGYLKLNSHLFLKDSIPCNETFDTTITMRDTGNIALSLQPQLANIPHGWELILPFPTGVGTDSVYTFRIRHDVINVTRVDTLLFVLTSTTTTNGPSPCAVPVNDTLTFIYSIVCPSAVHEGTIATRFDLLQNYPNPFNPTTNIEYAVPSRSNVTLKVFNAIGEVVQVLQNGVMEPGTYKATFDATDLPSGNYFYEMTAGTFTKRLMMSLAK